MHLVDQYAYGNRLRTVDPAQKAALAVGAVGLCLLLDRPAVGVMAAGWMAAITVGVAGVPARAFLAIFTAEAFFLALSAVGIAVSVGVAAPADALALALPGELCVFRLSGEPPRPTLVRRMGLPPVQPERRPTGRT